VLVPAAGTVVELANPKDPGTLTDPSLADPPLIVEDAKVCPALIFVAVGVAVIVGVTFSRLITTVWLPSAYPGFAAATARTVT